jgi:tropomyosin 1
LFTKVRGRREEDAQLEEQLKDARNQAEEADRKYDEVSKKLQQCERDLDNAEERAKTGETKICELEEELRVDANTSSP